MLIYICYITNLFLSILSCINEPLTKGEGERAYGGGLTH